MKEQPADLPKRTISETKKDTAEAHGKACAALIAIVKEGQDGGVAEGTLYVLCKSAFYRVSFGMYQDRSKSQDTCSKAWEMTMADVADGSYVEQNSFEAYVSTIIRNLFYKDCKAGKLFVEMAVLPDVADDSAEEPSHFSDETKALLKIYLLECSDIMQDKITMHYIDAIPWKTIAEKYGISVDTVRSEVSRKLRQLKHKLE